MDKDELSNRGKWQDQSGSKATKAEHNFNEAFKNHFINTDFKIINKPKSLNNIYLDVKLSEETLSKIHIPKIEINRHGISPDFVIKHTKTGKILFGEIKRQDGWVEGKTRQAGRGNAHERLCKYFTPGLLKILREKGGIDEHYLPFWIVFQGDITRDICRVKEVTCWFDVYSDHFFFWRDTNTTDELIESFESKLKHLLTES